MTAASQREPPHRVRGAVAGERKTSGVRDLEGGTQVAFPVVRFLQSKAPAPRPSLERLRHLTSLQGWTRECEAERLAQRPADSMNQPCPALWHGPRHCQGTDHKAVQKEYQYEGSHPRPHNQYAPP